MKRTIAIFMAAMMLTGILTACGASVGMDTGRGYGNVSTTPNGTVNGGSGMYGSYGRGYTNGNGMTGNYGSANGASSGTGMTGGR